MERSFTLLRVRGIPIGMNWSWFFVFAFIVWTLTDVFSRTYGNLSRSTYWAMAITASVLFVTSLVLHELGHAFRALREGMEIEGITLWLFGGVARFKGMFPSAGAEFRIAIAGPLVSAVLVVVFLALTRALDAMGVSVGVVGVTDYLARINGILLGFNMIPALPLDGGRVLRSYLWYRQGNFASATLDAARIARMLAGALIAFGVFGFISGASLGGLWIAFIGWFLLQAAQAEASFAQFSQALRGVTVRRLMTPNPEFVGPDLTIASFIDEVAHARGHSTYPVIEYGRLVGLVSLRLAARVPLEERSTRRIADVMVPATETPRVGPDAGVFDVLPALQAGPGRAIVEEDGRVVGILSGSDIARAIELEQIRETAPGPRRRRPIVWIVVIITLLGVGAYLYRLPLVVLSPGESFDVTRDIHISGVPLDKVEGKYLLTSVAVSQPNAYEFVVAMIASRDIVPISALLPEGADAEDYFEQQRELFDQSQMVAAAAAAKAAGMDVDLSGTGAIVSGVVASTPAAGVLEEGDVITAVDGSPVSLSQDVGRIVRSRPSGTTFTFTIRRDGKTMDVKVRSRANIAEDAPGVGVFLGTKDLDVDLPFRITFSDRDIGGPSAGLTYALAVYDLIESSDLARGRAVATTGTIDLEGRVGPVGGLAQKGAAARAAGADLFLVPDQEVRDASGVGIDVRGVSRLEEAIASLRQSV
jgi:PDZ domain-containing secreted protein/Zn-dependent protease/CBS domain-containing protein